MGRMKRQRRYKACDPFSTNKKVTTKESKYDQPPKENDDGETRKFQRFQIGMQKASLKKKPNTRTALDLDKNVIKKSAKKLKTKQEEMNVEKLPTETKKQYFERLDQNVQDAINTTMMEARTLRKKRKMHLKARSEKLKLKKKQSSEADFNSVLKDNVRFGETVDEPPSITAAPRKTPAKSNKFQDLKLMSLVDKSRSVEQKDKRKEIGEQEKAVMDIERQRVIDAYRLMKKRKENRYTT